MKNNRMTRAQIKEVTPMDCIGYPRKNIEVMELGSNFKFIITDCGNRETVTVPLVEAVALAKFILQSTGYNF